MTFQQQISRFINPNGRGTVEVLWKKSEKRPALANKGHLILFIEKSAGV
jgi:hypothetical protein